MEEQVQQKKPLKGFSIAGIIVGSLGLLFSFGSFLPSIFSFFGVMALPFAWPALILGILGLIFANKAKIKKTAAIVAIVISVVALGISYYFSAKADAEDAVGDIENMFEEMEDMAGDLEDSE